MYYSEKWDRENMRDEDTVKYIQEHYTPEQVFPHYELESWAERNGYYQDLNRYHGEPFLKLLEQEA